MRITKICILLLVFVTFLAVFPSQAAPNIQINAVFDPLGWFLGMGSIGKWLEPGIIICPGNQPTNFFPGCPAGSRTILRGIVVEAPFDSSDPRLVGKEIFDINANLNAKGEGSYWGKWRIELEDGGVWKGSYTGKFTYNGDFTWTGIEQGELHGTGGSIDGMLFTIEGQNTTYFGGLAFKVTHSGYILNPHEKK
jgi:hypothetical protein